MYRRGRQDVTEKCKMIVDECKIRTQQDFAEEYERRFGVRISQTTVHRMFDTSNICIDSETGLYKYHGKPITIAKTDNDMFFELLKNESYGTYTHEKGVSIIWLNVNFNSENLIAERIYNYCEGEVSIICGFGCLYIKCHTVATHQKLKEALTRYKKG